jgi:cytochrome P450
MMGIPEHVFEHFDLHDAEVLGEQAYDIYRAMRDRCPVAHSDEYGGYYVITRFQDVYDILHDPETFSSESITIPPIPKEGPWIPIEIDPPMHGKYRQIILPLLSPQRVARFEPSTRQTAHELIDAFIDRGTADLATEYALPLPGVVLATLFDIPLEDRDWFQGLSFDVIHEVDDIGKKLKASMDLSDYLRSMIEARRSSEALGEDLMSIFLMAEIDVRPVTDDEAVSYGHILLLAGHETTASAIGNSLFYLATHPEDRKKLCGDPALLSDAVEEFLRFESPVTMGRVVKRDVTLNGFNYKEGDIVCLVVGAANRDGAEFEAPDECLFTRKPNRHIAFGAGVHRCVGSHLARMELKVALEVLLERIPDFSIPSDGVVKHQVGHSRGKLALPVQFPPGG